MSYIQFIDRIKRTDDLIRTGGTGSAEELASKLGVCRRTVFDYLDHIKAKGAKICYDKSKRTFYYDSHFKLNF